MIGIIGKKLGMTQIFNEQGQQIPVTVIEAEPNPVVAVTASENGAPGEVILDQASRLGCDLLVKCAYTQSRLRQMIFGGATRHILANATLPVFMAH